MNKGYTLASATIFYFTDADGAQCKRKMTPVEKAKLIGKELAEKALQENVSAVVFDRNGYLYHGRSKSVG